MVCCKTVACPLIFLMCKQFPDRKSRAGHAVQLMPGTEGWEGRQGGCSRQGWRHVHPQPVVGVSLCLQHSCRQNGSGGDSRAELVRGTIFGLFILWADELEGPGGGRILREIGKNQRENQRDIQRGRTETDKRGTGQGDSERQMREPKGSLGRVPRRFWRPLCFPGGISSSRQAVLLLFWRLACWSRRV